MITTLLFVLLPLLPQEDPSRQAVGQQVRPGSEGPVLVTAEELSVARYNPRHVDANELVRLAQQMLGRQLYVLERGGYQSQPVTNVQLIGDTLVLYDSKEYLQRMVVMLAELDQAEPTADAAPGERFDTWEYVPRYLSLEAAYELLQPLRRFIDDFDPRVSQPMNVGQGTSNISATEERRMIVVRDTTERIQEIRELLERVDVPQDQVTITCWLLQPREKPEQGPDGTPTLADRFEQAADPVSLPADLWKHLERILPAPGYRKLGFGLLQSTVSTRRPITVQLAGPTEGRPPYFLELRPVAFDRQDGSLSVESCTLSTGQGGQGALFSTSLVLRGGEFTVVGASNSAPVLVAIRVTPVGK